MFVGGVMCVELTQCVLPPLAGSVLYEMNCVGCHGVDGAGTGIAPEPIVGATAEEIDAAIANPEISPTMMGLSTLTPAEIDAIAAFLVAP
jgi:mono/diheme cytochrome c family protein